MSRFLLRSAATGLVVFMFTLAACQAAPAEPTPTPAPPVLRIINGGDVPIDNLVVIFPDERIEFGAIPAGGVTDYQPAPGGVYRYAAYELEAAGQAYQLPVIDWVGEEPVPGRAFTYVVIVNPELGQWDVLKLVEARVDE